MLYRQVDHYNRKLRSCCTADTVNCRVGVSSLPPQKMLLHLYCCHRIADRSQRAPLNKLFKYPRSVSRIPSPPCPNIYFEKQNVECQQNIQVWVQNSTLTNSILTLFIYKTIFSASSKFLSSYFFIFFCFLRRVLNI